MRSIFTGKNLATTINAAINSIDLTLVEGQAPSITPLLLFLSKMVVVDGLEDGSPDGKKNWNKNGHSQCSYHWIVHEVTCKNTLALRLTELAWADFPAALPGALAHWAIRPGGQWVNVSFSGKYLGVSVDRWTGQIQQAGNRDSASGELKALGS
jgi:hypothetical protein